MFFINWEKLKTFLIVLFAVLNVFLVVFTLIQNSKYSVISDETINDTVKILKSKGITVDPAKIDRKQVNLNVISLKNAVVSPSFPGGFTRIDEKTFSVETTGSLDDEISIKKLLASVGIRGNSEIVSDGKKAVVYLKTGGYPVFDVFLNLTEQGRKVKIWGSWYSAEGNPKKSSDTSDIVSLTGILIDFSNIAQFDGEIKVDKIELGYYVSDSNRLLERLNVTAAPCWRISSDDGKSYYFNARNGEFLKQTNEK